MKTGIANLIGTALVMAAVSAPAATEEFLAPGARVEKLAGGMKFTEGPVWLPKEKKLVFSDIPNNRLMQWSEADGLSVFRADSHQANGNILDLQGRLISCQHAARSVVRTEKDGSITVLADRWNGKRFNSPNDVAVRSDGTLWFTDPPWGLRGRKREVPGHWVYRLDPDSGEVRPVIQDLAMPNGIVFSPDERRLYVADTGGHRLNLDPALRELPGRVHCYAMDARGRLGRKLFHIEGGSDGMAVDVKGNLYTTHGGSVQVFDADGGKLGEIRTPEAPANCAFGGEDYRTLFITARSSLYRVRLRHRGAIPPGATWAAAFK